MASLDIPQIALVYPLVCEVTTTDIPTHGDRKATRNRIEPGRIIMELLQGPFDSLQESRLDGPVSLGSVI